VTAYITQDQLVTRFGETRLIDLTDHQGTGTIDEDALTQAMGLVEGEIDAYLSARYALPLATVPRLLTAIAGDLVLLRLHVDVAPDTVLAAARQARLLLADLRDGRTQLGLATAPAAMSAAPVIGRPGVGTVTDAIKDYLG
jgi:phage gp36-like protein